MLREAFSDPTRLDAGRAFRDPIPRTRETMAGTTSGTMLAQFYGGGTANIEFEALTGQSLGSLPPAGDLAVPDAPPGERSFPSLVGLVHRGATAPSPSTRTCRSMYQRTEAYRSLGFDDFVYDEKMHEGTASRSPAFISDRPPSPRSSTSSVDLTLRSSSTW